MKKKSRHWLIILKPVILIFGITIFVFFTMNWIYQASLKPSELLAPFAPRFYKDPKTTWAIHKRRFRKFSTEILTADFLAALAQTESSGNSIAHVSWLWRWSLNPFRMYSPASSATGLFQITDGNFAQAKHYCIHHGRVVSEGPWYDLNSCWFNAFYSRLLPSDATELSASYLDVSVTKALKKFHGNAAKVSLQNKQQLAAIIHLCGYQAGEKLVANQFLLPRGKLCGTTDPRNYLRSLQKYQVIFKKLERE